MNLVEGAHFLAASGLNLLAVMDCAELPPAVKRSLDAAEIALGKYQRLVLVGHGGRRMWQAMQTRAMHTADPVDDYSVAKTRQFIKQYLDGVPVLWLYPGTPYLVPLQQLGEAAGWSYRSPLGSGISPVYGVWFAYRAAFLVADAVPLMRDTLGISPCASCPDKPCIATCPASAAAETAFNVHACAAYRLQVHSPCADRCLARLACPFFPDHRYTMDQVQYHYRRSLETLQAWYGEGG